MISIPSTLDPGLRFSHKGEPVDRGEKPEASLVCQTCGAKASRESVEICKDGVRTREVWIRCTRRRKASAVFGRHRATDAPPCPLIKEEVLEVGKITDEVLEAYRGLHGRGKHLKVARDAGVSVAAVGSMMRGEEAPDEQVEAVSKVLLGESPSKPAARVRSAEYTELHYQAKLAVDAHGEKKLANEAGLKTKEILSVMNPDRRPDEDLLRKIVAAAQSLERKPQSSALPAHLRAPAPVEKNRRQIVMDKPPIFDEWELARSLSIKVKRLMKLDGGRVLVRAALELGGYSE